MEKIEREENLASASIWDQFCIKKAEPCETKDHAHFGDGLYSLGGMWAVRIRGFAAGRKPAGASPSESARLPSGSTTVRLRGDE